MNSTQPANTIKVHRFGWFGIGVAVALGLTGVVFGVRASAAPSADEATFVPIAPCRLLDTRSDPSLNIGPRNTPLAANDTFAAQVTGTNGQCTIPAAATGISLNVTAWGRPQSSFMTVFPSDVTRAVASNLNYVAGPSATPNKVDVKLSADGRVSFYNLAGKVDVIADVLGYYTHQGIQDILADLATKANAADLATKANAADVYTKADIDLALLRRQTFVGRVNTNGTKGAAARTRRPRAAPAATRSRMTSTGRTSRTSLAPMVIVAARRASAKQASAMADWQPFNSVNGFLTTMVLAVTTSRVERVVELWLQLHRHVRRIEHHRHPGAQCGRRRQRLTLGSCNRQRHLRLRERQRNRRLLLTSGHAQYRCPHPAGNRCLRGSVAEPGE